MKADTKLTVVMCCQIVGKRSTAPSSGRRHRCSVDWASDSYRSSLLLTDPTCLCIFQTKNKKKKITTFFSRFSCPIFVRKIRLKSLNQIYRSLRTADSPVIKTTKKDKKKKTTTKKQQQKTIETRSQKLGSMAGLGLRICQRMLRNCCFWYFLAIFFSK